MFEALGIPDPNDAKKKPAEEEDEEEEELPAGVVVLRGHTDAVTAVAWESVDVVWTGSMDHSLKSFDADAGTCVQTYAAPKCVMGLAVRAGGGMLAWCGGGDRMVHFWDPRVGNATGATTCLASHTVGLGFFFVSIRFVSLFSRPKRKPARMDHARERTSVTMTHTVSRRSDSMEEQISNFFPRRSLARAV